MIFAPPPPPVIIGDNTFLPRTLTVERRTAVEWTWEGSNLHNLSVASGPSAFRAPPQRDGTFTRRMRKPGTYKLVCTIHTPEMRMRLRVKR